MNNEISWYHGKIAREEAETLLKNDDRGDGLFFVRESNTSSGDYVLSVKHGDEVIHFQIRRHSEDAFFSVADNYKFHGLEALIEYYHKDQNILTDNLVLTDFIKGECPPLEARLHGTTNLLHRATCQGDYTVVTALLNSGYRYETKNDLGQTAVHIASMSGKNDILRKLIQFKANVNIRDTSGLTPLHYACQNNFPATVRLLVQSGGANIQARNTENENVPLHDAASAGHKDVIQELLSLNAPVRPRNKYQKTPAELAKAHGHFDCVQILNGYEAPSPRTQQHRWFHGTLSRKEAENLILHHGNQKGTFLVRFSERNKEKILTLFDGDKCCNYIIISKSGYLFIDNGPLLNSLEHIVEYYMYLSDGLPTTLIHPVPPPPKPPVSLDTMPRPKKTKPAVADKPDTTQTTKQNIPPSQFTDIKFTSSFSLNNNSSTVNNNNEDDEDNKYIPLERIQTGEKIGGGEFGSVYKGTYTNDAGEVIKVAIKTLRDGQVDTNRGAFLTEAKVMMKLNHKCIVRLIGLSVEPSLLMIQELVGLGSILCYMEKYKATIQPNYEFKLWAAQIASGMEYLETQGFVHRDLAARNILLATPDQVKISDFGLSRAIGSDQEYKASTGGKWPLKWYAPESYNYGQFSHKSDVWSFGVTIWEMYTFGKTPYGDKKGVDAIQLINAGERLPKPSKCPNHIFEKMLQCWDEDAAKRPTFSELLEFFESEPDYMNTREMLPQRHH